MCTYTLIALHLNPDPEIWHDNHPIMPWRSRKTQKESLQSPVYSELGKSRDMFLSRNYTQVTWIVHQRPIYPYDPSLSLECTTFHNCSCQTMDRWAISSSSNSAGCLYYDPRGNAMSGCCRSPKDCSVNLLIVHLCSGIHCHYCPVSPTQYVLCHSMFCNSIIMVDLHSCSVIYVMFSGTHMVLWQVLGNRPWFGHLS